MRTVMRTPDGVVAVSVKAQPNGRVLATIQREGVEPVTYDLQVEAGPDDGTTLRFSDGRRVTTWVGGDHVAMSGWSGAVPLATRKRRGGGTDEDAGLAAPMPGTVLQVRVEEGQEVQAGDVLVVIEAMKMEHSITATKDATVTRVYFAEGDRVGPGDALVELGQRG